MAIPLSPLGSNLGAPLTAIGRCSEPLGRREGQDTGNRRDERSRAKARQAEAGSGVAFAAALRTSTGTSLGAAVWNALDYAGSSSDEEERLCIDAWPQRWWR
jgi:hypothetical protein